MAAGLAAIACAVLAGPARAALPFERCQEEGAEEWECATHTVPLDWTGATPGTIGLEVRRYRPEGSPDPSGKLPFVALAGGPGQSATDVAGLFAEDYAAALADYQLIVYDQRGTGLSGALDCPAMAGEDIEVPEDEQVVDPAEASRKQAAACAEQLGPRRAHYTTVDSARDIDSIRAALDAERVGIGGVSYGTYVSAVYAQLFPQRTDRIVLDSVLPPTGLAPFGLDAFEAIPRIVKEQCEGGVCADVTPSPLGDLRKVLGESDPRIESVIFMLFFQGDFNAALRGGQPAAFRSAVKGDAAPLERLIKLGLGGEEQGAATARQDDSGLRENSEALNITTRCTDIETPWPSSLAPGGERNRLFRNALTAIPFGQYFPFGRPGVRSYATTSTCLRWPVTDSAPPPEHPPLPDVPTLIVNGSADVRTPEANAILTARESAGDADLVIVEGTGHSVIGSVGCVDAAVERFFADQPIEDPCADADEWAAIEPLPPRSLAAVKPLPKTEGRKGRTLGAVAATAQDLEWVTGVKQGRSFEAAGLRGGRVTYRAERKRYRLDRLAYVLGVKLTGRLERSKHGALAGTVRVQGKAAADGKVKITKRGKLIDRRGRLGNP